jgi:hypothetical protein
VLRVERIARRPAEDRIDLSIARCGCQAAGHQRCRLGPAERLEVDPDIRGHSVELGQDSPERVIPRQSVGSIGPDQQDAGDRIGGERSEQVVAGWIGPVEVLDDRHDRPAGRCLRESLADLRRAVDLRKGRGTRNQALTRYRQRRNDRFERIERRPGALVIETASPGHHHIRDRPATPGARKGHLEELQLVAPRDQGRTPIHDRHARSMPAITRLITTNLGEKPFKFRTSAMRGSRGSNSGRGGGS